MIRPSRKIGRTIGLALAVSAVVLVSCQVLLDLEEPRGVDRGTDAAADAKDPCAHADPPSIPAVDDDPTKEENFWFAAERVVLPLRSDGGVQPGFDLDQSCTCQPDLHDGGPPCITPSSQRTTCDADGGVDDALGRTIREKTPQVPGFDPVDVVNREVAQGGRTFLMFITRYNGRANDRDVGVAFIVSGGLYDPRGCDGNPRDAGPYTDLPDSGTLYRQHRPLGDGCDRWSPNEGLTNAEYPRRVPYRLDTAYVNDYTVVVRIDEVTLDVLSASARASNALVVARLIPNGDANPNLRFRTEGVLAGRLPFRDLVRLVGGTQIELGGEPAPLCRAPAWAGTIAPLFCDARDTMQSAITDHTNAVCDAVSASIGFAGVQTQVSDYEYTKPFPGGGCPDVEVKCDAGAR